MAELVDALVSGTSISNDVQVQVLFWAPLERRIKFFIKNIFCPGGGIGRHASLRGWCSFRACKFESCPGHLSTNKTAANTFFAAVLLFLFPCVYISWVFSFNHTFSSSVSFGDIFS